jgi:hypothetical protein
MPAASLNRTVARPDGLVKALPGKVRFILSKKRRGGYVFLIRKGDHSPRNVHVYRDGRLIVKWDLDNARAVEGSITRRVKELIEELENEGEL